MIYIAWVLIILCIIFLYLYKKDYNKRIHEKLLDSLEKEYMDGHSEGFRFAQELQQEDKKFDKELVESSNLHCGDLAYQIGYRQALEDSSFLIDELKTHTVWLDNDKCKSIIDKLNSLKF